jgi:signal transduction histidine kinase
MRVGGKVGDTPASQRRGPARVLAVAAVLWCCPAAAADAPKLVVAFHPNESDGAPGVYLADRAIRSTFAAESPVRVEVRNEYVDVSRLRDPDFEHAQVALLRQKYAGRKVDLVFAGLSSGLDFALEHRDELFPGVPVVYIAVDEREAKARRLPPDVTGVPVRMDLTGTLDLALRLHPGTRRVFVVAGCAPFDAHWAGEARRAFRRYEDRVEFVYLTGLPMADLLDRVADLPARSIVYYLHVFQDGGGATLVPAEALERLAARANAPIYGHVDTYVGRGAVGGRAFSIEAAGRDAAHLALRILAGEKPESIPVPEAGANTDLFDWRQLRRWGISESSLPPGSVVRHNEPTVWSEYKWQVVAAVSFCLFEAVLIAALLVHRQKWRRAEGTVREGQRELKLLAGRLLEAQEAERRRIARELHDDVNQTLALLAIEMESLARTPPDTAPRTAERVRELSERVKELSSSVHDLSHQLHPSKLEQVGLVAAVGGLCQELAQHHNLAVAFTHADVPEAIAPAAALCLYRIAQEALRNVVKHGGTDRATVELSGTVGGIRLRVSDDGAGFDPAHRNGGLGLVSMRERLHLVGGELTVDARPAGGTRIDVRVPTPDRYPEDTP